MVLPHARTVPCMGSVRVALVFSVLLLAVSATPSSAQALADGWQFSNIGSPAVDGAASVSCQGGSPCQVSLSGAGEDIWGASDQFSFLYRQMTGDGVIIVRVSSLVGTDSWSRVGLMVRESLDADAAHGMVIASSSKGLAFQRRRTTGGTSLSTSAAGQAPIWLKLERRQSSVIAYRSSNGTTWSRIGTDTVEMGPTVYVGLAMTSHNPSAAASAVLTDLSIPLAVPDGWETADVGESTAAATNANAYADDVFTVIAAGRDIWDTSDQFRFTYRRVSGDVDIVSRVRSIEGVDGWIKAGVMVRESTAASAAHASVFVSRENGIAFHRRPIAGGESVGTSGGTGGAPAWVKLERRGDRISAFWSLDGALWTFIGEEQVALPPEFYVGLALTSRSTVEAAKATFDGVSVRSVESVEPPNASPRVTLTTSATGVVAPGTAVGLTASASDDDGSVTAVDFIVNGSVVQSDGIAPYSTTWMPGDPGVYQVTAVARDDRGATTVSDQVVVTVQVPAPTPTPTPIPPLPRTLAFAPSPDHATGVEYYVADIATAAVPGLPVATLYLGKPAIVADEISADVGSLIASLPSGEFVVTVTAIGPTGVGRSETSLPFTR